LTSQAGRRRLTASSLVGIVGPSGMDRISSRPCTTPSETRRRIRHTWGRWRPSTWNRLPEQRAICEVRRRAVRGRETDPAAARYQAEL